MKTLIKTAFVALFAFPCLQVVAQEDINNDNEIEEIIIKKKGGRDANLKIEIKDGEIKVNGQSLVEFNKGEDITISKKKLSIGRNFGKGFEEDFMQRFELDMENLFERRTPNTKQKRAFLGVSTEEASGGVKVTDVSPGSAAAAAGLEKDDIISKVDEVEIDHPVKLSDIIAKKKVNDKVSIDIIRKKKKKTLVATLQENKNMDAFNFSAPKVERNRIFINPGNNDENFEWKNAKKPSQKLGLRVTDLKDVKGVKITEVEKESAAAISGLMVDDIIIELNGTVIANTDDARKAFSSNKDEIEYPIKLMRNKQEMVVMVYFPKEIKEVDL